MLGIVIDSPPNPPTPKVYPFLLAQHGNLRGASRKPWPSHDQVQEGVTRLHICFTPSNSIHHPLV